MPTVSLLFCPFPSSGCWTHSANSSQETKANHWSIIPYFKFGFDLLIILLQLLWLLMLTLPAHSLSVSSWSLPSVTRLFIDRRKYLIDLQAFKHIADGIKRLNGFVLLSARLYRVGRVLKFFDKLLHMAWAWARGQLEVWSEWLYWHSAW